MRSDTEIRREVIREFKRRPSLRDEPLGVAVKDGVVTLTGTVATFASKYQAEHAAEIVPGVRRIASDLDVKLLRRRQAISNSAMQPENGSISGSDMRPQSKTRLRG